MDMIEEELQILRDLADAVRAYGFPDGTAAGEDIADILARLKDE